MLVSSLNQFRRATLREFVFGILRTFSDVEFTLPLMATLLLLDEEGELSITHIAELLGRSVSTTSRLIDQLVGCGTSIGGNYCEANEGISKRDFRHMISRCVKESKETKFFLRMLAAAEPQLADEARDHYREAKELHLIFASIFRETRGEPL